MTYPLPTRAAGDTAQDHTDDHNEIHDLLGLTVPLPTGLTTASTGHVSSLAHQARIHRVLNTILAQTLPTTITTATPGHLSHHNTIHALLNIDAPGIRGPHGPQTDSANIPGYPSIFTATIGSGGTYATIAAAASGGSVNDVFQILPGTYTAPAIATVKAGQQFWGHADGVTLTHPGGAGPMFTDGGSNKANVKIMNLTMVGFRRPITCNSSANWEVGYIDGSAENSPIGDGFIYASQQAEGLARHFVHHCHLHHTINPIPCFRARVGILIEDCEIDNIINTLDGSWKAGVQTWEVKIRHCWVHHTNRGIHMDYWNAGSVIEWCLIENNVNCGIMHEANPGRTGTGDTTGPWLTNIGREPIDNTNTVRYNLIRGNNHAGFMMHGSADIQVYGNIFYRNQTVAQAGLNDAEMQFYLNPTMFNAISAGGQGSDLAFNNIHHNYFEVTPTISGHEAKRGGTIQIQAPIVATPYITNTKQNFWFNNYYDLNRATSSTDTFYWNGNKSFATWQAIPQDAGSSVEA